MLRQPEERVCPCCSLGAALKLKPYRWSLLMLQHSSHRYSCAQACSTTVALLGNHQTRVWPWSLSLDLILTQTCHSIFWLLAGVATALTCHFIDLGSLENQLALTGLSHIQHDFGSAHISFSRDHTAECQWFQPLTKSKIYYNAHFLTKYYTIGFICAFSNILLNRKKWVEQDFFCLWKTQVQ